MSYTPPINITSLISKKYFYFDAVDKTNTNRLADTIKPYIVSDTSPVSTTSSTRTTLKTYTYDTTGGLTPRMIRVRIYGHIGASTTLYVYLNIDGTDVVNTSTSSTSSVLLIDYVGSITAGSHTIKVDAYSGTSGNYVYIDKVYIIDSTVITSTTSQTIGSVSLTPSSEYTLSYSGNFAFEVGIRYKIVVYRKTTASATINDGIKSYTISANDDRDNVNGIPIGNTVSLTTTNFTISVNVGASGDTLWVIGFYAQVTLRGNQTDDYNNNSVWALVIKEKGLGAFNGMLKTLDGSQNNWNLYNITKSGYKGDWYSSNGTEVIVGNIQFVNVYEKAIYPSNYADSFSTSVIIYLHIFMIG